VSRKPFDSPKLKIERARAHVAEFEVEGQAYLVRNPSVVFLERNRKTGATQIALRTREVAPGKLSAIFGDAIHNLRTSLDLLANDLVALCGAQPKKVYFPFADSVEGLEIAIKQKMRGASPEVLDLIRSLQPYRDGNIGLRALHDLDISDKHVDIIQNGMSTTTKPIPFVQVAGERPNQLKFKADFAAMSTEPFDNDGYMGADNDAFENLGRVDDRNVLLIIGDDFPLKGEPAITVLHQFVDLVEGIVKAFEAHFEGRSPTDI
jgi:hypothetical protein